jgi:hypothetical protein
MLISGFCVDAVPDLRDLTSAYVMPQTGKFRASPPIIRIDPRHPKLSMQNWSNNGMHIAPTPVPSDAKDRAIV